MASKHPQKKSVGRPRKKNREYAGAVGVVDLRNWSRYLAEVASLFSEQVARMEDSGMRDAWVHGREITKAMLLADGWVAKLEAAVNQELRRRAAGLSGAGEEQEFAEAPMA